MRTRRVIVWLFGVVALVGGIYVAVSPDMVLFTRQLSSTATDHGASAAPLADRRADAGAAEQATELADDSRTVARVVAHIHPHGQDRRLIRISIERPEPALYGLSIRMRPRLPLTADELRLQAPGGNWPPFVYERAASGLQLDVAGLRAHTTAVEFTLDTHGIDPDALQDTLPVTVEVDLRSGRLPVTALSGRAHFELPIRRP